MFNFIKRLLGHLQNQKFMKNIFLLILLVTVFSCKKSNDPVIPTPKTPPEQVTGVTVSKATITSITVEWTAVKGATGYKVYQDNSAYYDAKTTSFEVTNLTGNKQYSFQVSAYNNNGEGSKSLTVSGKTLPAPSPPGVVNGCKVKSVTSSSITWEWESLAAAEGFRLYRGGVKIYEGKDLSFEDKGLKAETTYSYQIVAFNANGEGPKLTLLDTRTSGQVLSEVVDDPKWVDFIVGKWGNYSPGEGRKFSNYVWNFSLRSSIMNYKNYYNDYTFLSDPQTTNLNYYIKLEKNILYTRLSIGSSTTYEKYVRLEVISNDEMKVFRIFETPSSYSESLPMIFTKISSVEKAKASVIESAGLKQTFSGIWEYTDSFYKNTVFDFSSDNNFYFDNYESTGGSKSSYKYEFKVSADNIISTRQWGSEFDPAWVRYKVTSEGSTMKWYKLDSSGKSETKSYYTLNKK